jgi:hypothetical protein
MIFKKTTIKRRTFKNKYKRRYNKKNYKKKNSTIGKIIRRTILFLFLSSVIIGSIG